MSPLYNPTAPTAVTAAFQDAYSRDYAQSSLIAPTCGGWFRNSFTRTGNRVQLVRFVPSENMTVTTVGFRVVTSASVNDNCDVGIYDSSLNKLVSAGATAGKLNAAPGKQTVTIASTGLTAGTTYFLAFGSVVGGTAGTMVAADFNSAVNADMQGVVENHFQDSVSGGVLGASVTSGGQTAAVPLLTIG